MEKPKLGERYCFIEISDDTSFQIGTKVNCLDDMDKYNFACGNFYESREQAEDGAFDMLMQLTLLEAKEVGRMIEKYKENIAQQKGSQ